MQRHKKVKTDVCRASAQMHVWIMGFYFRYKSSKVNDRYIYERIHLLRGRPLLDQHHEFGDNTSLLLGPIENLPVLSKMEELNPLIRELEDECGMDMSELDDPKFVLYQQHKCGIRMSDPIFRNNRLVRRFYVNFMPRESDDYSMPTMTFEDGKWRAHATLWEEDICMYVVLTNYNRKWWNSGNRGEVPMEIITEQETREVWMPYRQDRFVEHLLGRAEGHGLRIINFDRADNKKPTWDDDIEQYYKYLCEITANVTWLEESLRKDYI